MSRAIQHSRFWTRTTLIITAATFAAIAAWWLLDSSTAGALSGILFVAAAASSYLAIGEQEADEIGNVPHALDPYPEGLRRRMALGRLRDRAERARRKRRVGAHDPAPPEPTD